MLTLEEEAKFVLQVFPLLLLLTYFAKTASSSLGHQPKFKNLLEGSSMIYFLKNILYLLTAVSSKYQNKEM